THGLQKDTTIALVFEPDRAPGLYRDHFPVVWKVFTFRSQGHPKKTIHYTPRLAFAYSQVDQDNLVESVAWVEARVNSFRVYIRRRALISGQNDDSGELNLAGVNQADLDYFVCRNGSNSHANLSIGLLKGDKHHQHYEPVCLWTGVRSNSEIATHFTPKVSVYVTRKYKVNERLPSEVETDAIWSQNLDELDDVSSWNLVERPDTGKFSIEPARNWPNRYL
ncbi:unnamed protein product, partial [Rhizoctonia solani]